MHTKNTDIENNLVNGAIGTIHDIYFPSENKLKGLIFVKFDSDAVGLNLKNSSNCVPIKAVTESFCLPGKAHVFVERTQFPGTLAWAITVHKSQGSTYNSMIGHLDSKITPKQGQVYTMLSRVKSKKALKLIGFKSTYLAGSFGLS